MKLYLYLSIGSGTALLKNMVDMRVLSINLNNQNKSNPAGGMSISALTAPHSYASNSVKTYNQTFGTNFLTKIDGVICPCCGIKMVSVERFNAKLKPEFLSESSQRAIEALEEFEENLRPTEKSVFNMIKKLSKKSPNSTLQELIVKEAPKHFEYLQLRQLRVLDKIDLHTKELTADLQERISTISRDARNTIVSGTIEDPDDRHFKRKNVVNAIQELADANPENKTVSSIYSIAQQLPNSSTDVDSFFIKYSRRSSSEIGQRLVSKSISTIEHIHPQSKDGESAEKNYLAECAGCNNSRGSILMNDWIAMNPKMLKNLRLYMRQIVNLINTGKLVGHNDYPKIVTETIKNETIGNELKKEKPDKKLLKAFTALNEDLNKIADEVQNAA